MSVAVSASRIDRATLAAISVRSSSLTSVPVGSLTARTPMRSPYTLSGRYR